MNLGVMGGSINVRLTPCARFAKGEIMTDDRELLELAAKACGYDVVLGFNNSVDKSKIGIRGLGMWNPLIDDGDALRLAVKLKIDIAFCELEGWLVQAMPSNGGTGNIRGFTDDGNSMEATRRAIVRAAAEIGRAL